MGRHPRRVSLHLINVAPLWCREIARHTGPDESGKRARPGVARKFVDCDDEAWRTKEPHSLRLVVTV